MNRLFSIRRRRSHIVDCSVKLVPGITGYRLQWAPNFSGPWNTLLNSTNTGFFDPGIASGAVESQPSSSSEGSVRIVFDPSNFLVPDDVSFWLQMQLLTGGVVTMTGAPSLVLPDRMRHGQGFAVIQGEAPNIPPLQLELPVLAPDLRISNESAIVNLLVGCELDGPMVAVLPKSTANFTFQGTLFLAGNGSAAKFSASFAPTTTIK